MSSDAQIAREWAEKVVVREKITFSVDGETMAVARHILATTTPPTMADIAWDDEVHAGLCAEHPENGLVRMLYKDGTLIGCITTDGVVLTLFVENLTPIPGTRLDLTPRRHAEGWGA